MGKSRGNSGASSAETVARLHETLRSHPEGMHRLEPGATLLDTAIPIPLAQVLRAFDGADLFCGTLSLRSGQGLSLRQGRFEVGEISGDELQVDETTAAVWRLDADSGEWLPEGSRFDRWLNGVVEAERLLYDADWEYGESLFDDAGDLLTTAVIQRERCILKRDRAAAGPRWRLARALTRQEKYQAAQNELEEVVRVAPSFAWGWFDLARLSERLGALANAVDEYKAAAACDPDYEHAALFWAHAARLAVRLGDESQRAELAASALDADPSFARINRDGARECLAAGEVPAARELAELAVALTPRDLAVIDLLKTLESS